VSNNGSLATQSVVFKLSDQMNCSDEELLRAAQADPQAFDNLYRRYVERIYRYLFSYTNNVAEAEDLTSQTFLSAWKGLKHYRERGTFAAWLFHIARNKARDLHRHKHLQVSIDGFGDFQGESDLDAGFEKKEALQHVNLLLAKLDPEQIELLRLHFGAGLSYTEIGSLLRRSAEATKMAYHRLFQKLRSEWKVFDE
jgi:RNA polymerase sigma-70 factor, ECF subfamily